MSLSANFIILVKKVITGRSWRWVTSSFKTLLVAWLPRCPKWLPTGNLFGRVPMAALPLDHYYWQYNLAHGIWTISPNDYHSNSSWNGKSLVGLLDQLQPPICWRTKLSSGRLPKISNSDPTRGDWQEESIFLLPYWKCDWGCDTVTLIIQNNFFEFCATSEPDDNNVMTNFTL